MTNREFKLNEKHRNLERDTRRFFKQLTTTIALDYVFPEPITIRSRYDGTRIYRQGTLDNSAKREF